MRKPVFNTLIAQRLASLSLKRSNLPRDLLDHVSDSSEVGIDERKFVECFFTLRFVKSDASSFFENGSPLARISRKNLVDLTLKHE